MERNIIGEIEKLIAGYQERRSKLLKLVDSYGEGLPVARAEAMSKAGTIAGVIDDLKRIAGIE